METPTRESLDDRLAIHCRTASLVDNEPVTATETIMSGSLIDRNPDILGGTPVFAGTRVPVRILMEHLEAGDRLDDFLNDYPSVSREQAVALLEEAKVMLAGGRNEAVA